MTDLLTRLLALAELAVDAALEFDYGDPEDRHIYRELQELKPLVATALSQPEPEEPTELIRALELAEAALADIGDAEREPGDDLAWAENRAAQDLPRIRAVLTRWGSPAIEP